MVSCSSPRVEDVVAHVDDKTRPGSRRRCRVVRIARVEDATRSCVRILRNPMHLLSSSTGRWERSRAHSVNA